LDTHIKGVLARIFFGKPIHNEEAHHQTIGKAVGLAVFASDALSSVAYATQEILLIAKQSLLTPMEVEPILLQRITWEKGPLKRPVQLY
jgi:hypothetical protein